jgi:hypothetical protein
MSTVNYTELIERVFRHENDKKGEEFPHAQRLRLHALDGHIAASTAALTVLGYNVDAPGVFDDLVTRSDNVRAAMLLAVTEVCRAGRRVSRASVAI